ncbi:MAG: HAMP domain-containing histidine kinase, partial [Leptolyngbyaceae cyanobacterium CAN_BIN12]|nr:HAMP domain-containing histidine kinase [Leptolyngbyaceae cyanobacterium CAN_BIN12]
LQNRLKGTAGQTPIEVIKDYGELPLVECYVGQLNQVFMNILSNAIDALEQYNQQRSREDIAANPPIITIHTEAILKENSDPTSTSAIRSVPKSVLISIRDNGSGIPMANQSRLFDPFFTTKPIGKGTGLGLSISYQIVVEKHRGTISCISEPGKGSEFRIEIPVLQEKNVSTEAQ